MHIAKKANARISAACSPSTYKDDSLDKAIKMMGKALPCFFAGRITWVG